MKNMKAIKRKRAQYFYMFMGAVICFTVLTTATKAKEALNTVQAYSNEPTVETPVQESKEELAMKELKYINEEQDVLQPAYMDVEMMDSLGVSVGDTIELPNIGKAVVRNIETMRENVIIVQSREPEVNSESMELYEYVKVNGGVN